jgi:hypothetical protein
VLFYGNEHGYVNFAMVCIYLTLYYKTKLPAIRNWVASLKAPKYTPIYSVINDELQRMGISGTMTTEMAAAIMKYENQLKTQHTDKDDEKDRS